MKLKKYDYVIFALLAAVTALSILIPFLFSRKYDEELVVIEVDGKEYKTLPLHGNATIPVKIDNKYNFIEIIDSKVHIEDANCPDKLCVKDGFISKPGQVLVCLPHKVLVGIKGNNKTTNEVDESTY